MAVKTLFNIPYAGVDKDGEYDLLIGLNGECSIVIQLVKRDEEPEAAPVVEGAAEPEIIGRKAEDEEEAEE